MFCELVSLLKFPPIIYSVHMEQRVVGEKEEEEEEEELTGEREAQCWVTSFSDLIILSSLKSYGNISAHSLPWQPGGRRRGGMCR